MEQTNKKNTIIRFTIVITCCIFWMTYRLLYLKEEKEAWTFPYCFNDKFVSEVLRDFTRYLTQHWYLRNFLMISSSSLLDIFFLTFLAVYILTANSWRHIVHFGVFYGIRNAFVQSTFLLEIYDTYIFYWPDFPSIVVPLSRAADFFYSGHAGASIVIGIQLREMGYSEMFYAGIMLSIYEAFVLCSTRAHYGIDIVFGVLMAHYTFFLSQPLGLFLDDYFPICGVKEETGHQEIKNEGNIEQVVHVEQHDYA
jgi:hypothetical protein